MQNVRFDVLYMNTDTDIYGAQKTSWTISYAENVPIKLFPNINIDMQINSVDFILLQMLCKIFKRMHRLSFLMLCKRCEVNKTREKKT